MGSLDSLFGGGGGLSASSSAKSGDQSAAIENGLSGAFVVGDGNNTGAAPGLAQYLPLALAAGVLLVGVIVLRR